MQKFFSTELVNFNSYSKLEYTSIYPDDAIFIHIRRGDYYTNRFVKLYGGICTLDYYTNALMLMINKTPNLKQFIVIISDDPSWVEENVNFKNMIIHKSDSYLEDWFLMKNSKNLIISNSTFSLTPHGQVM